MASRGLLWQLDEALSLPPFFHAVPHCKDLAGGTRTRLLSLRFGMGHCWLCLVFALVAAAPNYTEGDVPVAEVPVAHRWAPCLQDENPEPQEGRLVVPKFSTCMLRCAAQAMLGIVGTKPSTSLKLNAGREGKEDDPSPVAVGTF